MWLITRYGFFSIVEKPGDQERGQLTVRSRVRADLDQLRREILPSLSPTLESTDTDYRFRAYAAKEAVAQAMQEAVMDIDYNNFKSAVAREQGHDRAHVYADVWSVLYQLQKQK